MRNLEKRHFLTSRPAPDPDLEMKEGGGRGRSSRPLDKWGGGGRGGGLQRNFFPPFGPQFGPKIRWKPSLDPPLMTMPFPDFS